MSAGSFMCLGPALGINFLRVRKDKSPRKGTPCFSATEWQPGKKKGNVRAIYASAIQGRANKEGLRFALWWASLRIVTEWVYGRQEAVNNFLIIKWGKVLTEWGSMYKKGA